MILSEKKYAKDVLLGKIDCKLNMFQLTSLLTRYNAQVLNMTDVKNYEFITQWLKVHDRAFSEYAYSNMIQTCVRRSKKRPLYEIKSINVTKTELEKIRSLKDVRFEKVMFVLLCAAKFQRDAFGFNNNLVDMSGAEIFRDAHVSEPAKTRDNLLHELMLRGMISFPHKVDSRGIFVDIVDESSDVVIKINENDAANLCLVYQAYINPEKYTRCSNCDRIIPVNRKCAECDENEPDVVTIRCVDCGKIIRLSNKSRNISRCPECRLKHKREDTTERVRRWREHRRNAVEHSATPNMSSPT